MGNSFTTIMDSFAAHDWVLYIAAFACAFAGTLALTPLSKKLSVKFGAIDYPRARGMHKDPIPRMGGIAIVAGFFITVLALLPFIPELRTIQFLGFTVGTLIIVGLGMLDDMYSLRARTKLIVQIVAAIIVVFTGTRAYFLNLAGHPLFDILKSLNAPITVIWIVGVTNAVNLIDGVDGLAAGVSSIAGICLTILCILSGSPLAVFFAATLTGSCLGFLPRNFSPAEIIMGDTGATFLGFVLAASSIIGVFKSYAVLSMIIAVMAMALPILDTAFAMLRRAINRKPIMSADRGHLHHRLIDAGYSHKQAVIILYVLSLIGAIISILIAVQDFTATVIVAVTFSIIFAMVFVYRKRTAKINKKSEQ